MIIIIIDVVSDWAAGGSLTHIALEMFVVGLALIGLASIWSHTVRALKSRIRVSDQRLQQLEAEAQQWRERVSQVKPSLDAGIDQQFAAWRFTPAEQDIARLLLKGLTNKEIADIRSSSDKTIKQQTASIYRKSGLTSRSQLAAFFLEDLF